MLNAKVLSSMMKANVLGKMPITALVEGQGDAFFDAMAEAIVTHIQTSADVVVPSHVTVPVTGGEGFGDGGVHMVGNVL